jgi:hypothetical protein
MQDNPTIVDNAERSLDLARENAAGPVEGMFRPGSAIWHIDERPPCSSVPVALS